MYFDQETFSFSSKSFLCELFIEILSRGMCKLHLFSSACEHLESSDAHSVHELGAVSQNHLRHEFVGQNLQRCVFSLHLQTLYDKIVL